MREEADVGLDARTAHRLRMLATGIAALLAALAALAAIAPLAHAAAVTGVSVAHGSPSPAAGARTQYVVGFTTSKEGALSGADASINVTFPADTGFTGYTGGSVVDVTTRRSVGSCGGPNLGSVSCGLFSGEAITAGDDVRVSLNGVTNPSKPSEYSLTVSTTTDATPASSPFYVIVAGASLTVSSVANAPSQAVSARTKYVVRLATSKSGGGL